MPWHPRELRGRLAIMLRRNVGHGQVLGGRSVRWGHVARVLAALARLGPSWRLHQQSEEPMNRWYDPRLFEVISEERARWKSSD